MLIIGIVHPVPDALVQISERLRPRIEARVNRIDSTIPAPSSGALNRCVTSSPAMYSLSQLTLISPPPAPRDPAASASP